jgi:methyl-accepting chemotaxis protein
MDWKLPGLPNFFARAKSMRRRVAYSLGIVRLILVPVILLSVYYLFRMGWIVDRIVSVDAMVAMQAERASIVMLDARRTERSYFLLHDQQDLESNRQSISDLQGIIRTFSVLEPEESGAIGQMQSALSAYQEGMNKAAQRISVAGQPRIERLRSAVRSYEENLNKLIGSARTRSRSRLIQELHNRTSAFDSEIAAAGTEDPVLESISGNLQKNATSFLSLASELERHSWDRVMRDHQDARSLMARAEWVLGTVSLLTLLISIWVSFVLPREVVQPLLDLKEAVDNAAAGDYKTELDLKGKGEVVDLAHSVRRLIAHVRKKRGDSDGKPT